MKNITFSADEKILEKAKLKAQSNKTTLNKLFREWVVNYTREKDVSKELDDFLGSTSARAGRSFTRDEFNER